MKEEKKRTDLDEPDDDQDCNHGALDGGFALLADRSSIELWVFRVFSVSDAALEVLRGVLEDAVEEEGAGDDAEDEVGGQHRPVYGNEPATSHGYAHQAR